MASVEPGFYEIWFDDSCTVNPVTDLRVLSPRELSFPETIVCFQILVIGILFTLLRSWTVRSILGPIADRMKMLTDDYPRFFESAWQMAYYTGAWFTCAYFAHQADFFKRACLSWVEPFPYQPVPLGFHWIYILSLGWYLHCFYAHVFLDPRKKDYYEMLIHHVVTFALLLFAYSKGYTRIGILVLYCMDVCDIFLHICKLLRIFDNAKPLPSYVKNFAFPFLPISWVVFRLFFYVRKVMYSTLVHPIEFGGWRNSDLYTGFNVLLIILLFLQLMWFYYIMKTAVMHVFYGDEFDDERDPHAHDKRKSQ